MAKLVGVKSSNDESLEIKPIKKSNKYYTIWKFSFESKCTRIKFGRTREIVTGASELVRFFEDVIKSGDSNFSFETIEPVFEIELERIKGNDEFIINFWVDLHGLGKKEYHSSYNASRLGINFITNIKNIQNLLKDLKIESRNL